MGFKTDIEIAQECTMEPITAIAEKAGIEEKYLEQYGKYKAKIDYNLLKESDKPNGKLILVTAINPTPVLQMVCRNLAKMSWLHFVSHLLDRYLV